MKTIAIISITIYQSIFSPLIRQLLGVNEFCRYSPTCSQFAKNSIQKHGLLKGLKIGIIRLLSCQPFSQKYANI